MKYEPPPQKKNNVCLWYNKKHNIQTEHLCDSIFAAVNVKTINNP